MASVLLPPTIQTYFTAKSDEDPLATLACFAPDASVVDNGEDLELRGIDAIRDWMTGTVSSYDLTTEPQGAEEQDGRTVVRAIVSGNFPGSPYAFDYKFRLQGDKIAELAIDPIGPVRA